MSTPLFQPRALPRFAEAAVERARLTVVPRRVQKAPRVPFLTLVSLLLLGGVAGLLLFNTNMQQASFAATAMEEQAAVLAGKEESLRMQLHRLRDPQHVAERARRLGMVPAASPAFIRLSDGKVLGRPVPASSADAVRIKPLPPAKPQSLRPAMVIVEAPAAQPPAPAKKKADTGSASPDQDRASRRKNEEQQDRAREATGRTP